MTGGRNSALGTAASGPSALPPPVLTLTDLPDDLLARCLAFVGQQHRFLNVALTCKRLRDACLSPPLLHSISLVDYGGTSDGSIVRRLHSLLGFLAQHAAHVRSLELHFLSRAKRQGALAALALACLATCAGHGMLEVLKVWTRAPLPSLEALTGFTRLRSLTLLTAGQPLRLPAAVSRLTALIDLKVEAASLRAGGPLPPSITRLSLANLQSTQLPCQITSLASLQVLELHCRPPPLQSLAALSSVRTLCELQLYAPGGAVPAGLSALTQLRSLRLQPIPCSDSAAAVAAALPHLCQLTCLSLAYDSLPPALPAGLKDMPLQRLSISVSAEELLGSSGLPALPLGPWLSSIRWLGAPFEVLQSNMDALRAAPRLECLACLTQPSPLHVEGWLAFFGFLAEHPPLRCLSLTLVDPGTCLFDAMFELHRHRPGLRWARYLFPDSFADQMHTSTDLPF
ncbi:hypothetical protein ABPG75_010544 [Micractinium tetrahymenae]